MRESTPRILTGMHAFDGRGYDSPVSLGVTYSVPSRVSTTATISDALLPPRK